MATVQQYQEKLWKYGTYVSVKMGCDPDGADKATRTIAKSILTLQAVQLKMLVDKGVISDAELEQYFLNAGQALWPEG